MDFIHRVEVSISKLNTNKSSLACSRLSVSGGLKKRAADEWGLVGKEEKSSPFLSRIPLAADPACRPLAFSIVLTDREPETG